MARKSNYWQDELRKSHGNTLVEILEEVHEDQGSLLKRVDLIDKKQDAMAASMKEFQKAFPNGDVEGHCRYHRAVIEHFEERKKLYRDIRHKTISGLIWAAIVYICAWVYDDIVRFIQLIARRGGD